MTIEFLNDNITHAEQVAEWIYNEFIKDKRSGVSYEQVLNSVKLCCKDKLPVRLIALLDGRCVGTVAIVQNDLKGSEYTPWLAALYVDEAYRKNKIGEQLIEHVKAISKELGYSTVYLRTEHAGNYYKKLGWQYVETRKDEFGLNPGIFEFKLT
jgi:predicted N-acetyltransferase YhbS